MKLSEIVGRIGGEWHPEGAGLVATCPSHADSHPSLKIDLKPDGKVLMACRAGCEIGSVMAHAGLVWADLFNVENDLETVSPVASSLGLPDAAEIAVMAAEVFEARDRLANSGAYGGYDGYEYAMRRFGLDSDDVERLGLGVTADRRLLVPFNDPDGRLMGYQGRAMFDGAKAKWKGPQNPAGGGGWAKVGYFLRGAYPEVLVCEGPGDGVTAAGAGYNVAMIRGASLARQVVPELVEALGAFPVVLATDADEAGLQMRETLAEGLSEAGVEVFVLEFPEGVEDVADWCEKRPETFAAELQAAVSGADRWSGDVPDEGDLPALDLTHLGLAKQFGLWLGGSVAFVPSVGFHVYRDGVWVMDDAHRVRRELHKFRDRFVEGDPLFEEFDPRSVARAFVMLGDGYILGRVMVELEAVVSVPLEWFDQHADLLVVANGVVDLRTGELLAHDPLLYMTKKVDVAYDASATSVAWEKFLADVFRENPDLVDYMQRLIGYGITGETKEQCFGVLYGLGANGKSVFTDTLRFVFDGIAQTTPFSSFEQRASGGIPNDIAALRGARLVFASEGESGKPMSEAVIKSVTGQDLITARFMRKEFFSFKPSFLILMASNHKPRFRSQDVGLWRRVKLIPWKRFFEEHERDKDIFEKMQGEAQGVLTWAIEGAIGWYAMGLDDPKVVVNATEGYKENSDDLSGYFPDVLAPARGVNVLGADAYKAYVDWCDREELPPKSVWSRKALYAALEERGVERKKMREGMTLLDCELRAPELTAKVDVPGVVAENMGGLK